MDFDGALKAHNDWKVKLRAAIANRQKVDAAALGKDNVCPLGIWLHGEARARFGALPTYQRCLSEHAAFHREASKVALAINAARFVEADKLLAAGSDYSAVSQRVGVAIVALRREAKV